MKRLVILLAFLVVCAGLAVPAVADAATAPTIYSAALVQRSTTVSISGRVSPDAQVQIWFHRQGDQPGAYTLRRDLTADGTGVYRASYLADTDYRYFARSAGLDSKVQLTQVEYLAITGPADSAPGATVRISGRALPAGSTVGVYFHRAGQPASYYSLRRQLHSDSSGLWSTSYVADADYRYYATASGLTSSVVLTKLAPPWLVAVNSYRSAYGLAGVTENSTLSGEDALHVRYMAFTGLLGHSEDPASSYYTPAGNAAAGRSNVAGGNVQLSDVAWINLWMTGPFHEIGVLRPSLNSVGYASGSGPFGEYAALDVLGDTSRPDPGHWPRSFPSAAAPFPFLQYGGGETPDPLSGCPATFSQGAVSPPLLVSLGPSADAVTSAGAALVDDSTGKAAAVCVQTESTYRFSDPSWQATGRSILRESHSIVVFAAGALVSRSRYTFTVTPAGHPAVTVTFTTA